MFNFGSTEDNAALLWENALAGYGPELPDCHYDEMSEKDLKNLFAYIYSVLKTAIVEGAPQEVIDLLTEYYDEVFVARAASDKFKAILKNGRHHYIPDFSPEVVNKYHALAGIPGLRQPNASKALKK